MLTDAEVRAELERIDPDIAKHWDLLPCHDDDDPIVKTYRLLAVSQKALGEIALSQPSHSQVSTGMIGVKDCSRCIEIIDIAKAHYKGGK